MASLSSAILPVFGNFYPRACIRRAERCIGIPVGRNFPYLIIGHIAVACLVAIIVSYCGITKSEPDRRNLFPVFPTYAKPHCRGMWPPTRTSELSEMPMQKSSRTKCFTACATRKTPQKTRAFPLCARKILRPDCTCKTTLYPPVSATMAPIFYNFNTFCNLIINSITTQIFELK